MMSLGVETASCLRETPQERCPPFLMGLPEAGIRVDYKNHQFVVFIFLHHSAQYHFTGTRNRGGSSRARGSAPAAAVVAAGSAAAAAAGAAASAGSAASAAAGGFAAGIAF